MGTFYQGESTCIVMRCLDDDGETPADLAGKDFSVILRDCFGEVLYRFSTLALENAGDIYVHENVLVCRLSNVDTSSLEGTYRIEVKVTEGDVVMIGVTERLKVVPSIIGKELEL